MRIVEQKQQKQKPYDWITRFDGQQKTQQKNLQKQQEVLYHKFDVEKFRSHSKTPNQQYQLYKQSTPPSEKFQLIQKERKTWQENQKQRTDDQRQLKEMDGATFHPKISNHTSEKYKDRKRTPEQFYQENLQWKQNKKVNLDRVKDMLHRQQEKHLYRPQLCQHQNQQVQKGFYQRLDQKKNEKAQHLMEIQRSNTPSFQPYLMNKSVNRLSKSPAQISPERTKTHPSQSFEHFEHIKKRQQEEDFFKNFNIKIPVQGNDRDENINNDANSAIWKIIQRCELDKEQNNSQYFQQPVDEYIQSPKILTQHNGNLLHGASFGNLQQSQNLEYSQESNFQMILTGDQDEIDKDNPIQSEFYADTRVPNNFYKVILEDKQNDFNNDETPQQYKRHYFSDKITSITENIQKLFKESENKRQIQQKMNKL